MMGDNKERIIKISRRHQDYLFVAEEEDAKYEMVMS